MEQRKLIEDRGGDLVVFFNAKPELVESWRESDPIPEGIAVLADPRARLYTALGTVRRDSALGLARGSLRPSVKAIASGRLPKLTSADMLRLGADVAVRDDGEIARLHRAATPDDRVELAELVAALG